MALDRTNITVVDDDGTETTGTVFDAEFFDAIYDAIDAYAALLGPSEDIPFFALAGPTALRTFTFPDADATVFTSEGIANTALKIYDTNASHFLSIVPGSDLSADRTFTLVTGDAARTLTLSGNPTLGDWFDQAVKQASSPTFTGLTVTTLTVGAVTLNATEAGFIDGVTAGTVAASKALVVDANKDLASLRNLTITGTFTSGAAVLGGNLTFSAHNTYDIGLEGSVGPRHIFAGSNLVAGSGATASIYFSGKSQILSPSDGVLKFANNGNTDFNRLQFGGTTSSFPALKRSSATLQARLADDSSFASFAAASLRGAAVAFASLPGTPVEGMLVAVTDSSTATWGATITGGGANHVLAYYNGTNWTVAGK